MQTAIRNHLVATVTGTGVPAAMRALHNLYGLSGAEIAFALGRDRTMVSAYLNGHKDMPAALQGRLIELLQTCIAEARKVSTQSDAEDELLASLITRTEEIISGL